MAAQIGENEVIDVQGVGGRKSRSIPKKDLADVLEARAEETLNLIQHDIKMSGLLPMMGSGVVLTGGASQLQGLIEMGEFIFDIPIRKGVPSGVGGLSDVVKTSEYSTAVGLLKHGFNANKDEYLKQSSTHIITDSADSITKKMKDFFGQIF